MLTHFNHFKSEGFCHFQIGELEAFQEAESEKAKAVTYRRLKALKEGYQ